MDPVETKQASPHLVVGEEHDTEAPPEGSVHIVAEKETSQLPLSLETLVAAPAPLKVDTATESEAEKTPLVLSVMDILAGLGVVFAFFMVFVIATSSFPMIPEIPRGEVANFLATCDRFLCIIFNLLFCSYWLGDVTTRIHRARKNQSLWKYIDKLACIHPLLLLLLVGAPSSIILSLLSGPGSGVAAISVALVLITLVLAPALRWLYLTVSLFHSASHLEEEKVQKSQGRATYVGALASASLLLPFLVLVPGFEPAIVAPIITLLSGACFIELRNLIIQSNPTLQLAPAPIASAKISQSEGLVQIRYNHFVEIQKWFKQRFALHSPWKIGVLLVILIAALAGHLHIYLGEWIGQTIGAMAGGSIKDGVAAAASGSGLITNLNSLGNSILVLAFGWITFLLGAGSLITYLRAPKKLAAGKYGLRLIFARVSGKADRVIDWQSVSHIKVERPPGKTSAASDKLIFEQFSGQPLTLKLAGISSADDREKLLGAIDRFAPQISREAAIEETLRRPADQNYTELWLQALAAPPKREKLKPLVQDAVLSDNRYLIKRELGVGGQGFAYLALDQRKDKEVVLKEFVLPVFVDINARRQSLESFEKEAKLMTRLDHPQVVKLEGFFVEDHRAYLVLEHIDGQNLRQIIERDGPMSEARIRQLANQMCTILTYLHGLSPPLVHRDFTPDNLILNKDGTLKLIDFNVAQQVEYATTGTVVGKQAYLPPEQFRGQAVPASDLYAFGATLYFLAGGKDPTPISVARPIKDGLPLSEELDHLISDLTQMEPQGRPVNAQAVADLLLPNSTDSVEESPPENIPT